MKLPIRVGLVLLGLVLSALFSFWITSQIFFDDTVHVVLCDVGQGDAILIWQRDQQLLIDAGKTNLILGCLEKYMPWWDSKVEMAVATHPDADHIGGFTDVLQHFSVGTLLITNDTKNTADFIEFKQLVQRQEQAGLVVVAPQIGQQVALGTNISGTVVWPPDCTEKLLSAFCQQILSNFGAALESANNRSIVLFLRIYTTTMLLTGDLEKEGEQALLKYGLITKTNILKVGHHGAKNSTSDVFLQRVRPEKALISVGKNNQYGHPNPATLTRLIDRGIQIARTDLQGVVEVVITRVGYKFIEVGGG